MRKLLIGIISLLLINPLVFAYTRNVQDNYQLIYHIVDSSGDPVASETVALKIKRASDGHWYDFDDDTFKASGWTTKAVNLSEDATENYYYYTYNPPAGETGAEQYIMLVDNASVTYGDHQSLIIDYQVIPSVTQIQAEMEENGASILDTLNDNQGNWITADVSGLATSIALATAQADLDNPAQYKATGFSTHSAGDVVSAMQVVAGDFKADVSGLATSTALATAQADLDNPAQYKATGFSTHSAADVWGVTTRQLTGSQTFNITGNLSGSVGSLTTWDKAGYSLSSAGIDSIWDEVQTGHSVASSFGLYLDSKVSEAGGGGLTSADIADAVWDEALSGHTSTGTTGRKLNETSSQWNVGP